MFFWGLSCWCSSNTKRVGGGPFSKLWAIIASFHFSWFLIYVNIMCLKRTNILLRIDNQEKWSLTYNENFEKDPDFLISPFHLGALHSKTLRYFRQALEWSKFLKNVFFHTSFSKRFWFSPYIKKKPTFEIY